MLFGSIAVKIIAVEIIAVGITLVEILILGAIILIGLIFVYEYLESTTKLTTRSKILTADETSSTESERIRVRNILKNLKSDTPQKEEKLELDEKLPDPFENQNFEDKEK